LKKGVIPVKIMEISIMVAYLVFCIILTVATQRRIANSTTGMDDYYVAGRTIGVGVNSVAILAALGSGGSFMAGLGTTWSLGMPFLAWMMVGSTVGFPLASILVAKPLRNARIYTVPTFLNERYGGMFLKITVPLVVIIGSGMYLMSQMKAGGLIASYITGLSYGWGLFIISIIFILYVSFGGMLAVTWTNALQGGLMIVLVLSLAGAAIAHLPMSWAAFFLEATKANPNLGAAGATLPVSAYIGGLVSWLTAICVVPHLVMRIFTSRDVRSAKLSMSIGMLIYAALMFITIVLLVPFVPTLGAEVMKNNPPDMWLLLIAETFFGPLMIGLLSAGIMAAVMSTTDALLLACTASFAYDIYKGAINPEANQKQILRVSNIATWVIGLTVMAMTMNPPPFLIVLYTAAVGFMVSSLFGPLVLGIWWKRANRKGATAGLLVGAISFWVAYLGFAMPYNTEILVALPLSIITMLVVSPMTEAVPSSVIEKLEEYHA
jgi:SSS family transporter